MIYVAICDDDERVANQIRDEVLRYQSKWKEPMEVSLYTKSGMLQADIMERKYFDLILCDIEMPYMNGMTLAAYIRKQLPNALILFITSHREYAIDAYELSIFRYIPKQELASRLPRALSDAMRQIHLQTEKSYEICIASKKRRVLYRDIVYIWREKKYVVLCLQDGSQEKIRKSLTQIYQEIGSEDFAYVNRGEIANLAHVKSIQTDEAELTNGCRIVIDAARASELKMSIMRFWGKQL